MQKSLLFIYLSLAVLVEGALAQSPLALKDQHEKSAGIQDAYDFIIGKKIQLGNACSASNYQMYSTRLGGGHQYFANNSGLNKNYRMGKFTKLGPESFSLETTDHGNQQYRAEYGRTPLAITVHTVTLLNNKQVKIEIKDSVLDIVNSLPSSLKYLDSTQTSIREICAE